MILANIKSGRHVTDADFDQLYEQDIRKASSDHYTPVRVAKAAAKYLASRIHTKVLDIGSGAGKFCLIGAACTSGIFTGVEQRKKLHEAASQIAQDGALQRVHFLHTNITTIDFSLYDAFYFFNSFQEHISPEDHLNEEVVLQKALYRSYSDYVFQQLDQQPIGTKLATYYSFLVEVPPSYVLQSTKFSNNLKFWKKIN